MEYTSKYRLDLSAIGASLVTAGLGARIAVLTTLLLGGQVSLDITLITQILVLVVIILGFLFQQISRRQERQDREIDRKAAETNAQLLADNQRLAASLLAQATLEQTKTILDRSEASHQETLAAVEAIHSTATAALDQANHTNDKIATAVEALRAQVPTIVVNNNGD